MLKKIIKKLIPDKYINSLMIVTNKVFDIYALKSYSQEGEDMILRRIFEYHEKGFYVDVGAHHPNRFSNTYIFYKRGWSGINIDATPGSMAPFKKKRPRDINIEAAVSNEKKEMLFYIFNEPALNTLDPKLAQSRESKKYHIVEKKKIVTKTLRELLKENLPKNRKINFLSVDVEGKDLEVLQSNDWELFRPEYILVECLNIPLKELSDLTNNDVYKFLAGRNYSFFAKTFGTVIFKDSKVGDH